MRRQQTHSRVGARLSASAACRKLSMWRTPRAVPRLIALAPATFALPSARSVPCLPPLASGPLSEGPTAERPPRSSSRRNARSRVSPSPPTPPWLLVLLRAPGFPLSPSLFLSFAPAFPVHYPRTPLSFSRSSPISILFSHFPLRFRHISAVFFSVPLHSLGSLERRGLFSVFSSFSRHPSSPGTLRSRHGSARWKKCFPALDSPSAVRATPRVYERRPSFYSRRVDGFSRSYN